MSEGPAGRGRALFVAGLAIVGVLVLLIGVGQMSFGCFMVTDPACQSEATAKAIPSFVIGTGLLVAAILVGWLGRRQGGGDRDG